MKRRKLLAGLGGVGLTATGVIGSSAFSLVASKRTTSVRVAHDSKAYLGLKEIEDSPNSSYVDYDDKGHLRIQMDPDNPTTDGEGNELGYGVNSDSISVFYDLFRIRNHGKQPVCVWIEAAPILNGEGKPSVTFFRDRDRDARLDDPESVVELEVGEYVDVGTATHTRSISSGEQLLEEVVIHADAECPEVPPEPEIGVRSPGYWQNHPDAWPVEEITVGGETYSRDEAIESMKTPPAGDVTYTMFRQLVAAKLNAIRGAESWCIEETIDDADDWMVEHPPGSGVSASSSAWQDEGEALKDRLDDYNNGRLCAPKED